VSYNNEGYVTLGFRLAAGLVGQEWIMLETGMTVREGKPAQKLERTAISLSVPGGGTVPLATQQEYTVTDLRGIEMQSKVIHDSINYFPPSFVMPAGSVTSRRCRAARPHTTSSNSVRSADASAVSISRFPAA
jgi:hypothetical protein